MPLHVGPRYVVTPDHVEWRVGRRWASRRFDWSWRRHGRIASDSLVEAGGGLPDVGGVDSVPGLLLAAAAVAALLVVIPLLFFGRRTDHVRRAGCRRTDRPRRLEEPVGRRGDVV